MKLRALLWHFPNVAFIMWLNVSLAQLSSDICTRVKRKQRNIQDKSDDNEITASPKINSTRAMHKQNQSIFVLFNFMKIYSIHLALDHYLQSIDILPTFNSYNINAYSLAFMEQDIHMIHVIRWYFLWNADKTRSELRSKYLLHIYRVVLDTHTHDTWHITHNSSIGK